METMRRVVMVACAALLFLPVAMKSRTSRKIPAHAAFCVATSGKIAVKVSGAVLYPGIYEVPVKSMAVSVINMAVPLSDLKQYRVATAATLPLQNGAAVVLATQDDGSLLLVPGHMTVPERMILGIPLDMISMNEADFDRLPGIGPALARRIVEYRQNNGGILHISDLVKIDGIGEKKYKVLRPYFQLP